MANNGGATNGANAQPLPPPYEQVVADGGVAYRSQGSRSSVFPALAAQPAAYQTVPAAPPPRPASSEGTPALRRQEGSEPGSRRLQDYVLMCFGVECCAGAPCMMVQFLVFAWGVMLIVLTALTSGGITKPCDLPRDAPSVVNITLSGVADSCHSDTKVIVTKSLSVCAGALMILMNCYWLVLFAWNKRTRDNRENRSFTVPGCLGFFLAALFFFVTGALAMGIFQHYELFVYGENCLLDQGVCDEIVLLTVPLWAGSSLAAMILILLCACCMMCFILT